MWEAIKQGQVEREKTQEVLLRQISEEFRGVDEAIQTERKAREEEEERVLEMLRDVI